MRLSDALRMPGSEAELGKTTYFTNEIIDRETLQSTGYYQSVRNRPGRVPDFCAHHHKSFKDAKKCRDFVPDETAF